MSQASCEQVEHPDGEQLAELVVPQNAGDELIQGDAVVLVAVHLPPAALHQLVLGDVLPGAGPAHGHEPRHVLDELHKLGLRDHTVVINIKDAKYLRQNKLTETDF